MSEATKELAFVNAAWIFIANFFCLEHLLDFVLILPEEKSDIEFFFWDCLKQVTDFEMLLLIPMLSSHNVVPHSLDSSSNVSLQKLDQTDITP